MKTRHRARWHDSRAAAVDQGTAAVTWIAVGERTPKPYTAVLTEQYGVYHVQAITPEGKWFGAGLLDEDPPCHWWDVPLPEMPQPECVEPDDE